MARAHSANERNVDLAIHLVAIGAATAGSLLLVLRPGPSAARDVDLVLYVIALFAMLLASAVNNCIPPSRRRPLLKRLDHASIFFLIGGTYAPFLGAASNDRRVAVAYVVVWTVAAAGIALKLLAPLRFERIFVGLYVALGWSGLAVFDRLLAPLPSVSLALIGIGGAIYTAGVAFHLKPGRYCTPIWHGCVVSAAATHFAAVLVL